MNGFHMKMKYKHVAKKTKEKVQGCPQSRLSRMRTAERMIFGDKALSM